MRIDFIQPYAFDGKIGKEYHERISESTSDLVCITDQDTLKPPGFAERLHDTMKWLWEPGKMFTCMTNRIGYNHPAKVGELFTEERISFHLDHAELLWRLNGRKYMSVKVCPGYCMVFSPEDYRKLPQHLPDTTITFDKQLSRWFQTYLLTGIYIIHLYRWHNKDKPEESQEHLHKLIFK